MNDCVHVVCTIVTRIVRMIVCMSCVSEFPDGRSCKVDLGVKITETLQFVHNLKTK